jgi:glycosyltransferase involved in cell wall biosynthesis
VKSAVIITVYKRYKYIDEALNSVLSQTVKPDQIIIVADNPKMLNNSINATVIEADYPQLGKKIFEAIKALRDDIDIVYFLDDDDMFHKNKIEYINKIFEKRRDIVTIHNSRKLIDENGNDLNYEFDKIPFEIEIRKDNDDFVQLVREYNFFSNNSSLSIRKDTLEKIKNYIAQIDISVDLVIIYFSLVFGKLLHIPEKLTYFRVGSGSSTIGNTHSSDEYNERKGKIVCTFNRTVNDLLKIYSMLPDCESCKKIIKRDLLYLYLYLSAENNFVNCDYKVKVPSLVRIFVLTLDYYLKNIISTKDLYNVTKGVLAQLILGKKKVSEMRRKKGY